MLGDLGPEGLQSMMAGGFVFGDLEGLSLPPLCPASLSPPLHLSLTLINLLGLPCLLALSSLVCVRSKMG